jgi:hypothetical protein
MTGGGTLLEDVRVWAEEGAVDAESGSMYDDMDVDLSCLDPRDCGNGSSDSSETLADIICRPSAV